MQGITSKRRFRTRKIYLWLLVGVLLFSVPATVYYRYSRPIAPSTVTKIMSFEDTTTLPVEIDWPTHAQASIGTVNTGILASSPDQKPRPTASTAKLITALTILKEKPIATGDKGPLITMTQKDMQIYNDYLQANGSLVAIQAGERLSQYQMLQGILIRSGNNLADSLAIWAFGSLSEYQRAAQKLVDELGMANTTIGTDASGLSPTTTSTAEDLTRLAVAAMNNNIIRAIVKQKTSNLPIDGIKPNTNWMLGQNGVVGIKTGSTTEAGGVFVIASELKPKGEKPITIVGAIQGESTTHQAIKQASKLAEAAKKSFIKRTIVKKGSTFATVYTPWGETSEVVAASDITTFGWKGKKITPQITLDEKVPFKAGDVVGHITVDGQSSDLIAASTIHEPSWQWRIDTSR